MGFRLNRKSSMVEGERLGGVQSEGNVGLKEGRCVLE